MAVAGPGANLALFFAAFLLLRLGLEWHDFTAPYYLSSNSLAVAAQAGPAELASHLLSVVFSLNLLLLVFNLIPIPPLDGSNLPLLILPPAAAAAYFSALRSPLLRLGGLLLVLIGLRSFFPPILRAAAELLYFGSNTFSP
jgi:Zn-dependent protease